VTTYIKEENEMRHPRMTIAVFGVAAVAGVSGIVAATAGGSTAVAANSKAHSTTTAPAGTTPAAPMGTTSAVSSITAATDATVHTIKTSVDGKTESVLVDAAGLPLYYYKPDTATTSFVSGGLAALWPPLVSTSPTAAGVAGKVSVVKDVHGGQVSYNGHFLYTFAEDSAGHVSGQDVQDFFVATPGMSVIGTGTSTTKAPVPSSAGGYGY
jgi:predicted lipoprotein with Yx(FWY)xxD motif